MYYAVMKPNPPIASMICFSVYAAGLAFNRLYQNLLSQFGITYPQFLVLVALQQNGPQKVGALGDALYLESNTLTPLLKRMEKAGLITRTRDKDDERVVLIALTKAGAKLGKDIGCVPPQVFAATHMPAKNVIALTTNLNALTKSLRNHTQNLRV
jgi:DNA-binding MarR family transcriptional regulator